MSMQIQSIVLYNANGETRAIQFRLGQANIITGKSNTGKSTLIDIVEYCLGQSTFRIPEAVIRESVAWYAVIFQINDAQVFVAKPAPAEGAISQSQVYYETASEIQPPPLSKLVPNSNDEGLIQYLSRLIGISPNIHTPDPDESRQPLEATLRHTTYYLFQPQTVVANRDLLFYRQAEPYMSQAIKDTLPYLLGAVREDRVKLLRQLRAAKRDLKIAEQRLAETEAAGSNSTVRGQSLVAEAKQVGLIAGTSNPQTYEEIFAALRATLTWKPTVTTPVAEDRIVQLQRELEEDSAAFQRKHGQIREAEAFAQEVEGYSTEVSQQQLRLEAVNLMDSSGHDPSICPICSSRLQQPAPSATAILEALSSLSTSLASVSQERPRLREHIERLELERETIRQRIEGKQASIVALQNEQDAANQIREANSRIARVVGRISLFLETTEAKDDNSGLLAKVESARQLVEHYERLLDPTETEDVLASTLSTISAQMTEWAKQLELEFSGLPYRLDLNRLTVVVDRAGRPIPMGQGMGGGANWLGCHLIAYLALHKHFVEQNRPVPSFLILDQPTQIYFPEERYRALEGDLDELRDEDTFAVNRMFSFLFDVCASLSPNFQLIITDHANLNNPQFQSALVEPPWRGGRALVPESWYSSARD